MKNTNTSHHPMPLYSRQSTPLASATPPPGLARKAGSLVASALLCLALLPTAAQAQDWQTPYAAGSTADLTLKFNNGASGTAVSPDIPFAVGLAWNDTTPGISSGGGWGLSATGTAAVGVGIIIVGQTHTQTRAGSGALTFEMSSSGVSQIVGLSMGSKWHATSTIAGSDTWASPSNSYRYTFNALLSADVLSLSPAIFDDYTLTIQAGSNLLFQGAISSIIPNLTPIITGASVEFEYDQSAGPLQITWSGDSVVNTQLLGILGNGTNTIFSVNGAAIQVDAIPEPGTYALLLTSLGALTLYRRRARNG